jgi:hypothetical protein
VPQKKINPVALIQRRTSASSEDATTRSLNSVHPFTPKKKPIRNPKNENTKTIIQIQKFSI